MWIIFAVLCAVFYAIQGAYSKQLTKKENMYTITWAMWAFGIPVLLIPVLFKGIPVIGPAFYWSFPLGLCINMVGFSLFVYAVKISPLNMTYPFLGFTPVFMIFTGYIFLGEMPQLSGLAGIASVAVGAYVLNLDRARDGVMGPIRAILEEKGSLVMILVSFLWSFAATLDKVSVLASDPHFYIMLFSAAFMVFYMPFLYIKNPSCLNDIKRNFGKFLVLGTLGGIMLGTQMVAIEMTLVSYVVAIKRSGMVLAMLLGWIYFKEKLTVFKIIGTFLIAIGVALITIMG